MNKIKDIILLWRASELISFAEGLPFELITTPNAEPVYPVTVSELLVNHALHLLITHTWGSNDLEYAAGAVEDCLSTLDMGVNRPGVWKELFVENQKLRVFLEQLDS